MNRKAAFDSIQIIGLVTGADFSNCPHGVFENAFVPAVRKKSIPAFVYLMTMFIKETH
jgi:hypothetical protein